LADFVEGLEDWGVEQLVKGFIAPYVADGSVPADQVAVIQQAGIDLVNAALAELAKKVGATTPVAPENSQ